MSLHPEIQRKAQAEIDAVIGNDRLPKFSDQENLLYVQSLVKEVFRWNPVTPLGDFLFYSFICMLIDCIVGVAHRVTEDDVYDGYFIPKGAYVIANIW
jgi:cytochrome P450